MKKILIILLLISYVVISGLATSYTSQYPTHDTDHVKATTVLNPNYLAHFVTDPALSLTGPSGNNQWYASWEVVTEQRFHIDLGSAKIIRRIYYENSHSNGLSTVYGVQNFTFQGSNTEASFLELTYATDTGWTNIDTATSVFIEHIASDEADPHYITATNTTAYQYYAFKFVDNHTSSAYMGVRHIALQTEDGYVPPAVGNALFFGSNF